MSGPLVSASAAFVAKNSRIPPFAIEQSLRFDGSSKLSRASAFGNANASWTLSFWFKRSRPLTTTDGDSQVLVWSEPGGGDSNTGTIQFFYDSRYTATKTNRILSVWSNTTEMYTPGVQRDFSAWYHLVIKSAATSGTSGTVTYYLNGVEQVSNTVAEAYMFGPNRQPNIGARASSAYFSGYMAEFHYVHGTTKNYTDFGEFDDNGVWRPIEYTGGSYGANGFYLKFDPSATNGIGHDHSGNGNNWTPSGFTTSGTGTDVMDDTPTTNWCTLNPLQQSNDTTLSDGNLRFAGSVSKGMICGTQGATSDKYYWEFIVDDSGQDMSVGITNLDETVLNLGSGGSVPGRNTWSWGLYMYPLNNYIRKVHNTVYTDTSATKVSNGDVIGIAYDAGAGKMWASKNNTWMDSGDPAAGTNALFTNLSGTLAPAVQPPGGGVSTTNTANFGQRAFAYTPPTGFSAINTANLSAPDIADGSDYFQTVLYTGNNTTNPITVADNSGNTWGPDFVWIKPRSTADHHRLNDKVRGVNKTLSSNLTNAEYGPSNAYLDSFDSGGFTISSSDTGWNSSSHTYVAWNWLAGGSGSSNTDGSITSTVSVNPSAGFSIVSYTGNATSGATIGHGLGVAPSMVIVKNRDDGATHWHVYHQDVGNTQYLLLSLTTAATTASNRWNNTSPSSSLVTLGDHVTVNGLNDNIIAYCFAEVEGYSKFGSYTGNGNADGPFVYCGFKPAWVLIKNSNSATDWHLFDTARDPSNEVTQALYPDTSGSEDTLTNNEIDILSNGFKPRSAGGSTNGNGNTLVFAAFASSPFGGSGVSPATAR
jgi:hypothetical protein